MNWELVSSERTPQLFLHGAVSTMLLFGFLKGKNMIPHYAFDPALSPELEMHIHQEALHLHLTAVSSSTQ